MATFGRLSDLVVDSGVDHTGLGQWCWQLIGKGRTLTLVVVVYQPCDKNKDSKGFTTFQQQERYFEARGDFRSPRTILFEQLISQLLIWKSEGKEISLCGDLNKNVCNGRIAKRLSQHDLVMKEQCRACTGEQLPEKFATGSRPIDAVLATTGVEVLHAGILSKYAGLGDHRCFVLDFTSTSVFGSVHPRVLPHKARKLNCYCERIRNAYGGVLGQLADRHKMYKKLDDLTKFSDLISPAEFLINMNRWDKELTDYMQAAEDKCRKYKQSHVAWSPKFGVWKRRQRLLHRVERHLYGKVRDSSNLIRSCLKSKMCDPRQMTKELLKVELFFCKKEMDAIKAKAPEMRRQHLHKRLRYHKQVRNEKAVTDVTRIPRREANEEKIRRLRWSTNHAKEEQCTV